MNLHAQCPFNPQHVMPPATLQKHVIKCMKNYPGWKVCPYNALHRFPDTKLLEKHVLVCVDKDTLPIVETNTKVDVQAPFHHSINFSEENWDEELMQNAHDHC